jgi:hypothetical protein
MPKGVNDEYSVEDSHSKDTADKDTEAEIGCRPGYREDYGVWLIRSHTPQKGHDTSNVSNDGPGYSSQVLGHRIQLTAGEKLTRLAI